MKIKYLLPVIFFFLLFGAKLCYAAVDYTAEARDYLTGSEWNELTETVPQTAQEGMKDAGVSDISSSPGLTVSGLLSNISQELLTHFRRPLIMLCSLVGIILICVLLQSIGASLSQSSVRPVFNIIVSVSVVTVLLDPLIECILSIHTTIEEFSLFLTAYIPAFAGVITSAGQPMTAAAYNVLLFGICQLIGQILKNYFVPMICCYLSFAIVSEVCPQMGLGQMVTGIKSFITWALGLTMTIFFGLLTIQSVVASSGDTIAVRTTKFFISSFIPVVGSSLSDLFVATQGCMQFLKSTVGVFGIIVALFTFLPVLLQTGMWYIAVRLGSLIAGIFGVEELGRLLKSIAAAFSVILAILLYYSLLFIISTTLLIVAFKGG